MPGAERHMLEKGLLLRAAGHELLLRRQLVGRK